MRTKTILLGAMLLAACQATKPIANATAPPTADPTPATAEPAGGGSEKLFAHRWVLIEAAGQPVASVSEEKEAHLLFFPPTRLGGSTGCNRLTGSFELLGGGQLKFSPWLRRA